MHCGNRAGRGRRWRRLARGVKRGVALPQPQDGNAIVEFIGVMVVIIVPALVLLTGLATVTMAQLALEDAARQSARAFVRANSGEAGKAHAIDVARSAWAQRGFSEPLEVDLSCSARPCLTPGQTVTATVSATVNVPVVGPLAVVGHQSMTVDQFRVSRP